MTKRKRAGGWTDSEFIVPAVAAKAIRQESGGRISSVDESELAEAIESAARSGVLQAGGVTPSGVDFVPVKDIAEGDPLFVTQTEVQAWGEKWTPAPKPEEFVSVDRMAEQLAARHFPVDVNGMPNRADSESFRPVVNSYSAQLRAAVRDERITFRVLVRNDRRSAHWRTLEGRPSISGDSYSMADRVFVDAFERLIAGAESARVHDVIHPWELKWSDISVSLPEVGRMFPNQQPESSRRSVLGGYRSSAEAIYRAAAMRPSQRFKAAPNEPKGLGDAELMDCLRSLLAGLDRPLYPRQRHSASTISGWDGAPTEKPVREVLKILSASESGSLPKK